MITLPEQHRILVVDDEPDVHALTRLSLKGFRVGGREVGLDSAASGKEAVEALRARPETGVILMDVVMESRTAGLDACRTIRQELGNRLVRILLRTGQPGIAPERTVIDEHDIDGYLSKAELTGTKLYSAVRTGLRAFEELVRLARHREVLSFMHRSVAGLRAFAPLEDSLRALLETALSIAPASLAVLHLETMAEQGDPQRCSVHLSSESDPAKAERAVAEAASRIAANPAALQEPGPFGSGYLIPLALHRNLGTGWIYLDGATIDEVARMALPVLAAHASNALYGTVAQAILAAREGPFFTSVTV